MNKKNNNYSFLKLSLCLSIGALPAMLTAAPLEPAQTEFVENYCLECHNFDDYAGSLDLSVILNDDMQGHTAVWEKVIRKLRAGMMPPPGQPRPEWNNYQALTQSLEQAIDAEAPVNPGVVGLHRLNRAEYANAVRDLLALQIDTSALLPADTSARGFDNNAGSLTISPTLLEAYASAAARVAKMAVGFWESPGESVYAAVGDASQDQQLEGLPFGTRGGLAARHNFPADGEYTFYLQNFGVGNFIAGEQLELSIDGERVHLFDYVGVGLNEGGNADKDGALEVTLPVKAGTHLVGATFLLSNYRPSIDMIQPYERVSLENDSFPQVLRHPVVGLMKVIGPFDPSRPTSTPSRDKVFTCRPANADEEPACARLIISTLARQAYRRPVSEADLAPLLSFYEIGRRDGGNFEEGIEVALRRLLVDPNFLVRAEAEPADVAVGESYVINDLELASRLSFFLWSSLPDEELLTLAEAKQLSEPAVLEAQVQRMLADPRADSLVSNFAQQWLYLRNLPTTFPDGIYYPNWDDELRKGFQRETELLFQSILREDRSIVDLLDADYTFVNERLAKHYGIPHVYGAHFRRVELGDEFDYRRGLLGQGSFLSVTFSENFRTSPVKRGVWVLENILGTPPPEPPPNVPALEETGGDIVIRTLRQQMELHRTQEPCATCHKLMDGIGFALANFDADASWRLLEGHPRKGDGQSYPIDASVTLWDGAQVNGPSELRENLLKYSP
ncbi:MAG: DUF1592 domain-containing protein, partial [Pseudomonadales bacterium]|nr:DUF1592 domain-containing protein [Pseudomonadales bacterium]